MTQEEKARAYDEAIERARYWEKNPTVWSSDDICQKLFPELKESDERIRKEIIAFLKENLETGRAEETWSISGLERWIAWLEKQSQTFTKKDVDNAYLKGICDAKQELEKQGEQKPVWSEGDENLLKTVFDSLNAYAEKAHPCLKSVIKDEIDWLKSIKARYTWKPSDEQMNILEELMEDNNQRYFYTILRSLYQDLKKLREE